MESTEQLSGCATFLSNEETALRDEEVGRSAGSQSDKYLALRQLWWRYQPLNWTGFPGES